MKDWVEQGLRAAKDLYWRGEPLSSYSQAELIAIIGTMGASQKADHEERQRRWQYGRAEVLQLIAKAKKS